jgi:hypothetical protein
MVPSLTFQYGCCDKKDYRNSVVLDEKTWAGFVHIGSRLRCRRAVLAGVLQAQ